MKHSLEELLFAAAVRERIGSLRRAKTQHMTPDERAAFDAQPANALIEEVIAELDGIAAVIAKIRQRT